MKLIMAILLGLSFYHLTEKDKEIDELKKELESCQYMFKMCKTLYRGFK